MERGIPGSVNSLEIQRMKDFTFRGGDNIARKNKLETGQ
jgi:hypothetical protein